ncbi:MAG: NAD-binding protein [Actinobacteria bacterium]|nr:NAD-binding protein [Actinomycetota bacterium]
MPTPPPLQLVRLPHDEEPPQRAVLRRFVLASAVLAATVLVVYLGRDGYRDTVDDRLVRAHTVVVGYGTKGRSAVRALVADGHDPAQIVVVDPDAARVAEANADGLAAIGGDATRFDVLVAAQVVEAARVVVATQRDDTAVLVTLTVRQLNATAPVVVAVREAENAPLLTQSGATSVVVSSETAGRLLGLAVASPATGELFEDLLVPNQDLELVERDLLPGEAGAPARSSADLVVAVLRGGALHKFGTPAAEQLQPGDRVVVIRHTSGRSG